MISKISFRFYVTDPLLRYYLLRCFEEETMPSLDRQHRPPNHMHEKYHDSISMQLLARGLCQLVAASCGLQCTLRKIKQSRFIQYIGYCVDMVLKLLDAKSNMPLVVHSSLVDYSAQVINAKNCPTTFYCIFQLVWVPMTTTQNIRVCFLSSNNTLFS